MQDEKMRINSPLGYQNDVARFLGIKQEKDLID